MDEKSPIAFPSGIIPWSHDLTATSDDTVPLGMRAGHFTVALVKKDALMITVGDAQALMTLLGGVALLAVSGLLWWAVFSPASTGNPVKLAIIATVAGLVFIGTGLSRFGLLYTIDGLTGSLHRRRKFGPQQAWQKGEVERVTVVIEPQSFRQREKLSVDIRDTDNKIIERIYTKESRTKDSANSVQIARCIGRLLAIPVEVYGEVVHGTDELKQQVGDGKE